MRQQRAIRISLIRGGTSKGVYVNGNQLPAEETARNKVISRMFGSPDRRQIDGKLCFTMMKWFVNSGIVH